ncbi:TatD family hydrolase, partial [Bacteroidales bacterium OttesenSCG-928-L03]|nr:TatD family hydrolase [Bacteroidales bacterium OttesenSCG-928-L03]
MYIDIHTHNRSQEEDVKKIINIQVTNYINCCGFDLKHLFSLGIHPWKINPQLLSQDLKFLDENVRYDSIKAIGECGLDRLTATDWDLQLKTFKSQIVISEQVGKPMILHVVKAFDELIAIKKDFEPRQAWIIHGFRGKPQQMEQLIRQGFYLSFGTSFNPETIRETPIDK